MGLDNSWKKIIFSLFLIIMLLVQLNGSMNCNLSRYCENKSTQVVEGNDIFYSHPPSINTMEIDCCDITIVDDLILISHSEGSVVIRNISKIENAKEFTQDMILEYETIYSFYNNGNLTFVGMEGNRPTNMSVVGYLENSNISLLHKIIGLNLSYIHNIIQKGNNLFLFGITADTPQCEIYNICDLQYPSLINSYNLSEIDIDSIYPQFYEYGLYLDYQFYKNYLYHSTIDNKLLIYDFSNVSTPVKVKEFNERYSRVIFQEDLMYGITDSKLEILNNNNPLESIKIGSYDINLSKAIAVNGDSIYVITERDLILLEKENNEIKFLSKYELKERVNLKFSKIIIENNYALILINSYITNAWDTQSDLFVFDITNKNNLELLYPKIRLPVNIQFFFFYFIQYGILTIPIIIVIIVLIIYYKKKVKKSKDKEKMKI